MGEAIEIVEEVLTEHGHKRFENPPKPGIHPLDDAFIHAMPGYLPKKKAAGMKWVSGFSKNSKHGLPMIMGMIVLNEVDTGKPLAVMDGGYITALRTAAVSAVAARYLAPGNTKVLGIVGAGIQARYHLLTLAEVLPGLEVARIADIKAAVLDNFVSLMNEKVPFNLEPVKTNKEAIEKADILVTATGQLDKPIFMERWIKRGALVFPVHTRGWEKETLSRVDKFIVDDWGQFSHILGREGGYYSPLPPLYAELGEVVTGQKPGRENDVERIVNINFGLAIHDVLMAARVLKRARDKGLGTRLPLIEEEMPLA